MRKALRSIVTGRFTRFVLPGFAALMAALAMASGARAAVWTDQSTYSPGSAVTISGDNSDDAGYAPGETVSVYVSEPSGGTLSCNAIADGNGAWACQVTLPVDSSAIGRYDYTAIGDTSNVTDNGQFTDSGCSGAFATTRPTDNNVSASYTTSGGTATYTLTSAKESPSNGVPGLIEYCVQPSTLPDSATASYDSWNSAIDTSGGFFDFERPLGDPSNLPFDGNTHTVGTSTWSGGTVPSDQLIVLHINDPTVCSALYGRTETTCFVTPGDGSGTASDLTAKKDANPAYNLEYGWSITKSASPTTIEQVGGGSKTVNYTVRVTHDSGTAGGWKATGQITINNPNPATTSGVTVSDAILESDGSTQDPNASCKVDTSSFDGTIPANGDAQLSYTCTYSGQPSTSSETNQASVSWNSTLADGTTTRDWSTTATAGIDWSKVSPTLVDSCTSVRDSFNSATATSLGSYCADGSSSSIPSSVTPSYASPTWTLRYSRSLTVPSSNCRTYPNTAAFTTTDTGATGSTGASVEACGPAASGALTMGFWKNTNGQNVVKYYCQNGANRLGSYLAGLGAGAGPFSNAPAGCGSLATYVYNILKGASASNMNNMLKAQMLATALDVWFSGPGWTSTAVSGGKPPSSFFSTQSNLGGFKMDITSVCPMIDNLTAGTATCQNNTPSTNAVAAGAVPASPMTMQGLLDFAAKLGSSPWATGAFTGTYSNSVWYGGNRTLENVLKNIFDQFNNQLAFSP